MDGRAGTAVGCEDSAVGRGVTYSTNPPAFAALDGMTLDARLAHVGELGVVLAEGKIELPLLERFAGDGVARPARGSRAVIGLGSWHEQQNEQYGAKRTDHDCISMVNEVDRKWPTCD